MTQDLREAVIGLLREEALMSSLTQRRDRERWIWLAEVMLS